MDWDILDGEGRGAPVVPAATHVSFDMEYYSLLQSIAFYHHAVLGFAVSR